MTKHIEIFEGSKRDLEELTEKHYKAITNQKGELVKIDTAFGHNTISQVRDSLENQARNTEADAVVNVTYWNEQNWIVGKTMYLHGSGYLVKEVIQPAERTKDTIPFDTQ